MGETGKKLEATKLEENKTEEEKKENRPTLRSKPSKKKKMTDEEILTALRKSRAPSHATCRPITSRAHPF